MTQQLPVPTLQPSICVLSDEQAQAIHYATLEILEKVGVEVQDPQGRELLLDAGAWESSGRLKIPEKVVINALASTP
jgi:trimethylamine:corrinoid methyltransferase-like protein